MYTSYELFPLITFVSSWKNYVFGWNWRASHCVSSARSIFLCQSSVTCETVFSVTARLGVLSECHWAMSVNIVFGGDRWGVWYLQKEKSWLICYFAAMELMVNSSGIPPSFSWGLCMESSLSVFIHQDGVFLIRGASGAVCFNLAGNPRWFKFSRSRDDTHVIPCVIWAVLLSLSASVARCCCPIKLVCLLPLEVILIGAETWILVSQWALFILLLLFCV